MVLMFWVYAIYNQKHKKIYIGQSANLENRVVLHQNKLFAKSYTARFDGEWSLIYDEAVLDRSAALKREKQLKGYQGRRFLKQFIPA